MAKDYLSIPGTSVTVERVFSGGRDILGIRRYSLGPETFRTLMILKHFFGNNNEFAESLLDIDS
jgi:hAT family C-terminal dimerisation region